MYSVMTVCTGNICRSPMAEVVLRERLEEAGLADRVVVSSTGISSEERGNPMDPRAVHVLRAAGYTDAAIDAHSARQALPEHLGDSDLVLAMTSEHARALRRLADGAPGTPDDAASRIRLFRSFDPAAPDVRGGDDERVLDVEDPWYGDLTDFEMCLEQVEAGVAGVVEHIRERLA